MSARPAVVAVAGLLTALALGACGPGADPPEPSATSEPAARTDPAPALAVPDGVTLTPPGTELAREEPATIGWTPRQDVVAVADVRLVGAVERSVERALRGFDLTAAQRAATPWFVTVRVTNRGTTDLGGRALPLYGATDDGRLVAVTGVARDFAGCPGSTLPTPFAPGSTARSCLVVLVPDGVTLEAVALLSPAGEPVTWPLR